MVRSYEELNKLERFGLCKVLCDDGWEVCSLYNSQQSTSNNALTKDFKGKKVTVKIKDFHVDED